MKLEEEGDGRRLPLRDIESMAKVDLENDREGMTRFNQPKPPLVLEGDNKQRPTADRTDWEVHLWGWWTIVIHFIWATVVHARSPQRGTCDARRSVQTTRGAKEGDNRI